MCEIVLKGMKCPAKSDDVTIPYSFIYKKHNCVLGREMINIVTKGMKNISREVFVGSLIGLGY